MLIDPAVGRVYPCCTVALLSPARQRRGENFRRRVFSDEFGRGYEPEYSPLAGSFSEQMVEPLRTFEPPVPEEFSIKGSGYERTDLQSLVQGQYLPLPAFKKFSA